MSGRECWKVKQLYKGLSGFPTLIWTFQDGQKTYWYPRSYMYRKGSGTLWCYS